MLCIKFQFPFPLPVTKSTYRNREVTTSIKQRHFEWNEHLHVLQATQVTRIADASCPLDQPFMVPNGTQKPSPSHVLLLLKSWSGELPSTLSYPNFTLSSISLTSKNTIFHQLLSYLAQTWLLYIAVYLSRSGPTYLGINKTSPKREKVVSDTSLYRLYPFKAPPSQYSFL